MRRTTTSSVAADNDRLEALWASYTAAATRAQASGRIDDGIAAGQAWAAWLGAFVRVPRQTAGVLPRIRVARP